MLCIVYRQYSAQLRPCIETPDVDVLALLLVPCYQAMLPTW